VVLGQILQVQVAIAALIRHIIRRRRVHLAHSIPVQAAEGDNINTIYHEEIHTFQRSETDFSGYHNTGRND